MIAERVTMWAYQAAYEEGSGDPHREAPALLDELVEAFAAAGHLEQVVGAPILCIRRTGTSDAPRILSWELQIPHVAGLKPQPPLRSRTCEGGTFLRLVHTGGPEGTDERYRTGERLLLEAGASRPGRVLERYLDNPAEVEPQDLRTELLFELIL